MEAYYVVEYTKAGRFVAVISGMGRNKGKLGASHSRRSAQRHAAQIRRERPDRVYKVESNGVTL